MHKFQQLLNYFSRIKRSRQAEGKSTDAGRALIFGIALFVFAQSGLQAQTGHDLSLLDQWGSQGSGEGEFNTPFDVAIDENNGWVYVSDAGNHRIQKFDLDGNFLLEWGSLGVRAWHDWSPGQFNTPAGLAVDDYGDVYVADSNNHQVQKFDSFGNHLATWDSVDYNGLNKPAGIDLDASGNLYVADNQNGRIMKFDATGALRPFAYSLLYPSDVAVDNATGDIYAADTGNDRVIKYNSSGNIIEEWSFNDPWAIAVDDLGMVYVTGLGYEYIKKYDAFGNYLTTISADSGYFRSRGLELTSTGNLYATYDFIHAVQVYGIPPDADGDGVPGYLDNCPDTSNPDQLDSDNDGIGNACDTDDDNDNVPDLSDNCPLVSNAAQLDSDSDSLGNACDGDDDNDNLLDEADNCPLIANPDQTDTDLDGLGNICDPDDDNDTVLDTNDLCPLDAPPAGLDLNADGCRDGVEWGITAVQAFLPTEPGQRSGLATSFITILERTQQAIERGHSGAAKNQLNAFINKVEAQRNKALEGFEADILLEFANGLLATL